VDADQHEQLARRLAAGDRDIDIIGMDVTGWTWVLATCHWPTFNWNVVVVTGNLSTAIFLMASGN